MIEWRSFYSSYSRILLAFSWPALLLFAGSPDSASAQVAVIDSLQQVINEGDDTTRIDALISLGRQYRRTDFGQAIEWLYRAVGESRQLEDIPRLVKANTSLAITYAMKGDNATALEFFKENLAVNEERADRDALASSYTNLGIVYKNIGDYAASIDNHLKALQLYNELNDRSGKASCYSNLGILYHLMDELPQSRAYYEKSMTLRKELGEPLTSLYNNLGLLLEEEGRYDEALDNLQVYLKMVREEGDRRAEADALSNIGHLYWSKKAYDDAVPVLEEARLLYQNLDDGRGIANALFNLGNVELERGNSRRALALALENQALLGELDNLVQWKDGSELLYKVYETQGNYREALNHYRRYTNFRDSLATLEKEKELQKWQIKMNVYEKDRLLQEQTLQLKLLNSRAELDRRLRFILGLTLLLAMVTAFFLYQRSRWRRRVNRELEVKNEQIQTQKAEIERVNQELEKRMLRAQLNPHFIFNSLNSIQHFITAGDKRSALKYLSKFSGLLRQVLESSININIPLADEIRLMKTYLDLEALRFDQSFSYSIETDEEGDLYATEVPALLVQPFIENAILHGLMPKKGDRRLKLHFSEEPEHTVCVIRDNGIGRAAARALAAKKPRERISRGIAITKRRLQMLCPDEKSDDLLTIRDLCDPQGQPAGTEVTIRIPKSFK